MPWRMIRKKPLRIKESRVQAMKELRYGTRLPWNASNCNFDSNIFQCSYSFCFSSFVAQFHCSIYLHSLRYKEAIAKSRSCFLTAVRIAMRNFFVDCPNTCAFRCISGEGQMSPPGQRCHRKVSPLSSGKGMPARLYLSAKWIHAEAHERFGDRTKGLFYALT